MMLGATGRPNPISTGNETFDKFLGGGLLNSTLNIFERRGPSSRILDGVINKSIASATLTGRKALIYVNFNSSYSINKDDFLASLPSQRKVKSDALYKDVRGQTSVAKVKIAWRYTSQGTSSPTDGIAKVDQVDFGVPLMNVTSDDELGVVEVINFSQTDPLSKIISTLRQTTLNFKKSSPSVNVILKDILHPFSPLSDQEADLPKFMYALRCLSRLLTKGAIIVTYDTTLCKDHPTLGQQLYNLADGVVSFHSYETDENLITGYKDIDGSVDYLKVPKINSFGFHFQKVLSDWGYRLTKNNRLFVVDELSLPPCEADDDKEHAKDKLKTSNLSNPLKPHEIQPLGRT